METVMEKEIVMPKSAAVVLFVLFACGIAFAQETTGAMSGRVIDAQGLPVPGATVNVTGSQGVKNLVTDTDGRFAVPFLTPGQYDVRVELQGFKTVERKSVAVGLGQTVSLPVTHGSGRPHRNRSGHRRRRRSSTRRRRRAERTISSELAAADPGRPHARPARSIWRRASAARARRAPPIRPSPAAAASTTST